MKLSDKLLGLPGREAPHPNSRVAQALKGAGPSASPEFDRINALPRRVLDLARVPDVTPVYWRGPCADPGCGIKALKPIQSAMLLDAAAMSGAFCPVGVGHGKTLASLLLPDAMGSQRAVLLVPPQLRDQLIKRDFPHYATHFTLPDLVGSGGRIFWGSKTSKLAYRNSIYVVAYTELSSVARGGILEQIQPDLIIADEAHNLCHKDAARTRRFLRYMRENPGVRFVAMSGTMTSASLKDYAHLIDLALRKNSPVPAGGKHFRELQAWADAIDADAQGPPGALAYFCQGQESIREGFRRRLVESFGVVATEESAVGNSLVIQIRRPAVPRPVQDALDTLASTWSWDGVDYEDGMAIARVAAQLSAGFFYRWIWSGPGGAMTDEDREWLDARNAWNRTVRQYLTWNNRPGMDSPAHLEAAAERGEWTPPEWFAWMPLRGRQEPAKQTVWVSDYLVQDAALWGAGGPSGGGGIIWTQDPPVGDALAALGLPYFGADSDAELLAATPATHPVIVCSIRAHRTGKNLQAWSRNLVVMPPASGEAWEQMIGRTHREGQKADTVMVDVNLHTPVASAAWVTARRKALYQEETLGQRQKLLFATVLDAEPGA